MVMNNPDPRIPEGYDVPALALTDQQQAIINQGIAGAILQAGTAKGEELFSRSEPKADGTVTVSLNDATLRSAELAIQRGELDAATWAAHVKDSTFIAPDDAAATRFINMQGCHILLTEMIEGRALFEISAFTQSDPSSN